MMDQEIVLQFLKTNYEQIKFDCHISKIGLIGSFARNEQTEKSDIDLIVEFESGAQDLSDLKIQLKKLIKSKLNRDVDICREKYLQPHVKEFILKEAIYV